MENPFEDRMTFVVHSRIELVDANADFCSGRIAIDDIHHQPYGVVHGGMYCTLAETVASTGAAQWAIENGFKGAVGVSNKTDFLKTMTEGVLLAEATPIHRGRTQQLWQVNMTREVDGRLMAQSQIRLQNVASTDFE